MAEPKSWSRAKALVCHTCGNHMLKFKSSHQLTHCKDHPYPALKSHRTVPSQAPYCALISNHPPSSSFPASLNPSHHLSLTVFSLFHSDVLTLISLSLSGSHASTLDLILTALLPTHMTHVLTMAMQLTPSTLQCPVKWVLLSSLILFLSSLIFSFHPFIPFIASPLSCCLSSFAQWLSLALLATISLPSCHLQAPSNYHLMCHQHCPSCSESHPPAPCRPCHLPSSASHCQPLLRMGHHWTLLLYQLCAHCHLFIFFHYFPFVPFVHHLSPFVFTPS